MTSRIQRWAHTVLLVAGTGGWLFQSGCWRLQNELDVLISPEAMLNFAHQSWLVNQWPGVLKFWPNLTNFF